MPLRALREQLERVASGAASTNVSLARAYLESDGAKLASQAITKLFPRGYSRGVREHIHPRSRDVPFQE